MYSVYVYARKKTRTRIHGYLDPYPYPREKSREPGPVLGVWVPYG